MKLFKKGMYFIKEQELLKKDWQKKIWIIGGNTQENMLFGILIRMLHALQHGTGSLIPVNIKIIVIMNQNLEHVIVFIPEVKRIIHPSR